MFCDAVHYVILTFWKHYILELLRCVQLHFVTLHHVTFTLCCFTLCSNIKKTQGLLSVFSLTSRPRSPWTARPPWVGGRSGCGWWSRCRSRGRPAPPPRAPPGAGRARATSPRPPCCGSRCCGAAQLNPCTDLSGIWKSDSGRRSCIVRYHTGY